MKLLKDSIIVILWVVLGGMVLSVLIKSDLAKRELDDRLDARIEAHGRLIDEINKKIDRNQRLIDENQRILDAMPWNHKVPSLSELPERDTPAWSNWIERVQRDVLCN